MDVDNFPGSASGERKKFKCITYGCQANVHDSEAIAGILESMGYSPTIDFEEADLIILNTCSVREGAEEKVYGKLGYIKHLKEKKPELILAICGCMAQNVRERILERAPYVDLIFGTHNIHRLPDLLNQVNCTNGCVVEIWEDKGESIPQVPIRREGKIKALVSITFGCNNFCSYCIVPYVRGRERSRPPHEIIAEVQALASEGFKEVTLLGQNVNSYGKEWNNGYGFAELLRDLDKKTEIPRIRYMTSHPRDFSQEIVNVIKDSKRICEHFHLPIQAGSDRILKAMNRGYTQQYYLDLIEKVKAVSGATITTDIIVGFPGETEQDFQETLKVVQEVEFDAAYTFMYSPRAGTPAASMEGQIEQAVKKERLQRLMELQNFISKKKNLEMVGKNYEILVEGVSKNNPNKLSGRTRGNKVVIIDNVEGLLGQFVNVQIIEAHTWTLRGEIIKNI